MGIRHHAYRRIQSYVWLRFVELLSLEAVQRARAQLDQVGITGTITDYTGKSIQVVSIDLIDNDTILSFPRLCGGYGGGSISPIEIGTYALTVSIPGFDTHKQQSTDGVPLSRTATLPYRQLERPTVAGPGFNRLDEYPCNSRKIALRETALELRAYAIDLLNTVFIGGPHNRLTGGNAGEITSSGFSGLLPNARVLQFAGRPTFQLP